MKPTQNSIGLLTPEALVSWKVKKNLLKVPVAPKTVILTTQSSLLSSKKKFFGNKWLQGLIGNHLCIDAAAGVYLSTGWGIGSPGMIAVCEEFRVLGATTFYLIGIAGRLAEDIEEGSIVVASDSICDEGTSTHYERNDDQISPGSSRLINNFRDLRVATFVSTDAPFRETLEVVNHWIQRGASMVDMETSALYTFANFYGLHACSIAIGGDSLFNGSWKMVKGWNELQRAQAKILDVILSRVHL